MSFSSMLASAAGAAAGAVAKAVAGGPSLPFETGEEVKSFAGKSCWKLHSGKKEDKATGKMQDVSLFLFDMKDRAPAEVAAAKNGMRRMRTIKHPYLLKCYDAGEALDSKGGGVIWIATEPVQPLDTVIDSLGDTPGALAWGVYTLAAAVNFLNMDASSIHGQAPSARILVVCTKLDLVGETISEEQRDARIAAVEASIRGKPYESQITSVLSADSYLNIFFYCFSLLYSNTNQRTNSIDINSLKRIR